ncbi:MAG: hypothetical protein JWM47_2106 [Acidimicrobiales bacterium]|nr:hypothetical protein [Acidimicrobiales bacterium]
MGVITWWWEGDGPVGFSGADVEQLEALAREVEDRSRQLARTRATLTSSLGAAPWNGRHAEVFREQWGREHSRALSAAHLFLHQAGETLRINAQQQRDASSAGGGGAGLGAKGGRHLWDAIVEAIRKVLRELRDPSGKPLYENGAKPGDVMQGGAGDCWMLASLAAIVRTPGGEEYIKSLIHDNGDGTYTVTFEDGQKVTVNGQSDDLSSHTGGDKWVLILENAFAKKHGGLAGDYMDGNWPEVALKELGLENVRNKMVTDMSDAELSALLRSGQPVVAAADVQNPGGFTLDNGATGGHAFSVVDSTANTVTMRNPWGSNSGLSAEGVTLNSDGTFTISLADFRRLFFRVDWASKP